MTKLLSIGSLLFLVFLTSPTECKADSFIMATGAQPPYSNSQASGFLDRIAKNVFERLGHSVEVRAIPAKRAIVAAANGTVDGDMQRISGLGKKYPTLLPVQEQISIYEFTGFSMTNMKLENGLEDLEGKTVGYLRGWKYYQFNLPPTIETIIVDTPENLFKLLQEKRIEVALFSRWSGQYWAKKTGVKAKLISPSFTSMPMYMYLHEKHKNLISVLEKALKSMKREGDYDLIFQSTLVNNS